MINYMELEIVLQISPTQKLEHAKSLKSVTFVGRYIWVSKERKKENHSPKILSPASSIFPVLKQMITIIIN